MDAILLLLGVIIVLVLAVAWLIFPFILISKINELMRKIESERGKIETTFGRKLDETNDNLMMLKSTYAHPQAQEREG